VHELHQSVSGEQISQVGDKVAGRVHAFGRVWNP